MLRQVQGFAVAVVAVETILVVIVFVVVVDYNEEEDDDMKLYRLVVDNLPKRNLCDLHY